MNTKISRIKIYNYKAIGYGEVVFPEHGMLGVYGFNGTGKSSLVEVFGILQDIVDRESISNYKLPKTEEKETTLQFDFRMISDNKDNEYDVEYKVSLETDYDEDSKKEMTYIKNESIYYRKTSKTDHLSHKLKKMIEIKYDGKDNDFLRLTNKAAEIEFFKGKAKLETFVEVKKDRDKGLSTLFKVFEEVKLLGAVDDSQLIISIREYISKALIYGTKENAITTLNAVLPFVFHTQGAHGVIPCPIDKNFPLNKKEKEMICNVIEQLNHLADVVLDGRRLELKELESRVGDDGETEEYMVSFISNYDGKKIPLRNESDGIKKLFGIFSGLMNYCQDENSLLIIDEFDSGIFEFLLGELTQALYKEGKGQFLFTSHNLRALEVLPKESFLYSTMNKENRFTTLKKVKKTNNLRDFFIRASLLGGQDEELYGQGDEFGLREALTGGL